MKTYILTATTTAIALGLASCAPSGQARSQTPEDKAQQTAPKTSATTAPAKPIGPLSVPSGTYVMDTYHGYVTFSYSHFGFSRPVLAFRDVDATIHLDAAHPENSTVNVTIDPDLIDSGVVPFDGHLKDKDFFDVEQFKTISFKSTKLERLSTETGRLTGDLTIKGITRPVVLDVKLLAAGPHPMKKVPSLGIEAHTMVKRADFGLGKYVPYVSNEVEISVSAEFNKTE